MYYIVNVDSTISGRVCLIHTKKKNNKNFKYKIKTAVFCGFLLKSDYKNKAKKIHIQIQGTTQIVRYQTFYFYFM